LNWFGFKWSGQKSNRMHATSFLIVRKATRDILQQDCANDRIDTLTADAETTSSSLFLFELLERAKAEHKAAQEENTPTDNKEDSQPAAEATEKQAVLSSEGSSATGQGANDMRKDTEEGLLKQAQEEHEGAQKLRRSFPQYFPADEQVYMAVPSGWLAYVEKAFFAFAESGLKLTIAAMLEKDGALVVIALARKEKLPPMLAITGERFMNALLHGTRKLCPLCGRSVAKPQPTQPPPHWHDGHHAELALCAGCLTAYGMLPV
jgi:hypothetical protein